MLFAGACVYAPGFIAPAQAARLASLPTTMAAKLRALESVGLSGRSLILEIAAERKKNEVTQDVLIRDLYKRLSKSKNAEDAKLLVTAIERLWQNSGSDTINLLMQRASAAVQAKEYGIALDLYDAVVTLAPGYAEGWNQRAMVYFLREDYELALQDLRQVLGLDANHFRAIRGLAIIMKELGDKKNALAAYRLALRIHPFMEGVEEVEKALSREVEGQGI